MERWKSGNFTGRTWKINYTERRATGFVKNIKVIYFAQHSGNILALATLRGKTQRAGVGEPGLGLYQSELIKIPQGSGGRVAKLPNNIIHHEKAVLTELYPPHAGPQLRVYREAITSRVASDDRIDSDGNRTHIQRQYSLHTAFYPGTSRVSANVSTFPFRFARLFPSLFAFEQSLSLSLSLSLS